MSNTYNTLYNIPFCDYEALLASTHTHNEKTRIISQYDLEQRVIETNYTFGCNYQYTRALVKVHLVCPYGHDVYITPADFKTGKRCSNCAGNNTTAARISFEDTVREQGYKFGDTYNYKNTNTRVHLICPQGHNIHVIPNNLKNKSYTCIVCSRRCPTHARRVFEDLVKTRNYKLGNTYQYTKVMHKVHLVCPHGHDVYITPDHFKRYVGCSRCTTGGFNPNLPAHFYIQYIQKHNVPICLKFGITNKTVRSRLLEQSRHNQFNHTIFLDIIMSGNQALFLEKQIKSSFDCYYMTKDEMPHGYTETIDPKQRNTLLTFISEYLYTE